MKKACQLQGVKVKRSKTKGMGNVNETDIPNMFGTSYYATCVGQNFTRA